MAIQYTVEFTVEGKQWPGETDRDPHKGMKRSDVLRLHYEAYRPRDPQKNTFSNEAIQKPLRFVKEIGRITPLIHEAICKGLPINKMVLRTWRVHPKGKIEPYFIITVEDAVFKNHNIMTGTPEDGMGTVTKGAGSVDTLEIEVVDVVYRKLTVENAVDKNVASYDWDKPKIA